MINTWVKPPKGGFIFFVVVADLFYYGFLFFVLAIGRALDVDALCCSVPLGTRYDADICRIPKGMLSLRRLPTSHFAVPMARLYGWLPLSSPAGAEIEACWGIVLPMTGSNAQ
jgi:hypothetical protein